MEAPKSKEVFKNHLTHEALRLGCTQDSPGKLFGVLEKKKKKKIAEVCGMSMVEEEGGEQAGSKQLLAQRCHFPGGDTQHKSPEVPLLHP